MALGLLTVLTISGTAVTYYASTNLTDSSAHKARASAYDLAEAGINDAIATMNNQLDPTSHMLKTPGSWKKPTDSTLFPNSAATATTVAYPNLNGSVSYWGQLVIVPNISYTWVITSTGKVKSGEGYQSKTLVKRVKVLGDSGTGSSWSRFYDNASDGSCFDIDNQTFVTNVATKGNLCLTNGGGITGAATTVDVGGNVTITGPDATSPTRPPALGAGWPTTPTNIYTSNSAYAQNTIAAGAAGSNEDATNFGLTVPATAVVEGVTFTVQRMASACCNAVQSIVTNGSPTGGTFKLNVTPAGGSSTVSASIAYNASAATIQAAIVTIVGSGNVACTGGPLPTLVSCTFQNTDGNQPITLMTLNSKTSWVGGTSPYVTTATTTAGSVGAIQDSNVQLLKAGSPVGSNKAVTGTNWGTTLSTITYGSSSDLWGLSSGTLTGADVDATTFGLRFQAKNVAAASATASIDYVTVTVQYKPDTNGIGTSGTPVLKANIGGTCTYLLQAAHTPCTSVDHVYAGTITSTPVASNPALVMPSVDYTYWWANAAPGPKHFCTNASPGIPTNFFDNDASTTSAPNGSILVNGEMAPYTSDYTCQVVQNGVLKGEMSWNHTTHVMTISGVIFVDGNFRWDNDGEIVHYFGRANIMSSRDDEIDALVCAGGPSTLPDSNDYSKSCLTNMSNWDPTQNMAVLMSEMPNEYDQGGSGCPVNPAWGGTGSPNCYNGHPPGGFQGILYSTADCLIHQNFQDSGPVICGTITTPNEGGINPTYYTFPYVGASTDGQKYGNPATASAWQIQPDDSSGG